MTALQIAKKVRAACELHAKNALEEANGEIELDIGEDLWGMCGIASVLLAQCFKHYNIDKDCAVIYGSWNRWNHCWVESKDKFWDLTFSQFNSKKPMRIIYSDEDDLYQVVHRFIDLKSHAFETFFKEWPNSQIPFDPNLSSVKQYFPNMLKMSPERVDRVIRSGTIGTHRR